MAEDKKADKADKGEKKAGGGNKLMLVVVILLVLVLAGMGGLAYVMFTNMNKPHDATAQTEQTKEKAKKKKKVLPSLKSWIPLLSICLAVMAACCKWTCRPNG
jgi:flagellar FliL protein